MTVALRLFISSAIFAVIIAVAYWFVAHEIAGTMLLAFMAFGLSFIAGYMIVAEREAALAADRPEATPDRAAGEEVGTYTTHSPIPISIAAAVAFALLGIVVAPPLAVFAAAGVLALGAFLITESR